MFFLDSKVLLCDFHREQAWERWLNLVPHECDLLKRMHYVCYAGLQTVKPKNYFK